MLQKALFTLRSGGLANSTPEGNNMNILMASKIFVNSGVASHIKDLSFELQKAGHKVAIVSSNNNHSDFCKENNIEFFHIDFSSKPLKIF
jgi:hypothetical protein